MGNRPRPERQIISSSSCGLKEIPAFGRYHYSHAHAPLRPHLHPGVYEICYLERGSQTYVVEKRLHRLTGGDMLLVRPDEVHGTGLTPESPGRLYWLQFVDPRTCSRFLGLDAATARALAKALDALPRQRRSSVNIRHQFRTLFEPQEAIARALRTPLLRTRILHLLLELANHKQPAHKPPPAGLRRALEWMRERPEEAFLVRDLARIARMSESYFKATFTETLGMPPASYIRLARLEHSRLLLRQSTLSTTEIGLRLGFSSGQHFATAFRKQFGISPNGFRQLGQAHEGKIAVGAGAAFHPVLKAM